MTQRQERRATQHKERKLVVAVLHTFMRRNRQIPVLEHLSETTKGQLRRSFVRFKYALAAARRQHPEVFTALTTHNDTQKKAFILKLSEYVSTTKTIPSQATFAKVTNTPRARLKHYFPRFEDLVNQTRVSHPEAFSALIDTSIFNRIHTNTLAADVSQYKRFIITTAVVGCPVEKPFLESIRRYCELNDARLLVLPAADPAAKTSWTLDAEIGREHVVVSDLRLNNNVFVSTIKLSAKHIDPITGLSRLGQRNGTFIYASPKQRLEFIAMGNSKVPHALMTTGAITKAKYQTERYLSERTAYIATHDHVIGAVVLELEDDNRGFHFRQIQADAKGAFIDLGKEYSGTGVKDVPAAAVVLGDWHAGETDPSARKAWKSLCSVVRPEELFIHDGFNGTSINPHERDQQISRAMDASQNLLNLEKEVTVFGQDLKTLSTWVSSRVVVVKSNHDIFLNRYLQEGLYTQDPENHRFAIRLAMQMLDGKDPLQAGVQFTQPSLPKVLWLDLDDDYCISGIQLGAHGHLGPNGSRNPGLAALEKAYGACVTGHSHSAAILRNAYRVGTSSILKPRYNNGPSSWTRTSCIVYPNGSRQLISVFNEDGRWTTMKCKKA